MKLLKQRSLLFIAAVMVLFGGLTSTAFAEEANTITDTQLVEIQTHCSAIKSSLRQLHASDAVVRVNRGKLYERLSTKLMAPLNSRIALNRLDGTGLVAVTSEYEKHLTNFRTTYRLYEESLSGLLGINCVDQPARFYSSLENVRSKRNQVREAIDTLARDIVAYKEAFDEFAAPYKEAE